MRALRIWGWFLVAGALVVLGLAFWPGRPALEVLAMTRQGLFCLFFGVAAIAATQAMRAMRED